MIWWDMGWEGEGGVNDLEAARRLPLVGEVVTEFMELEAVSSTEKVPSVVGVPLIKPVVRLIERPGGRLAAVKEFAPLSAST